MSSALTQPLDLAILSDIAAGLACSCSATRDGQDEFEGIEREGRDLRRFARLLHTAAYEVWLIAWEAAAGLASTWSWNRSAAGSPTAPRPRTSPPCGHKGR